MSRKEGNHHKANQQKMSRNDRFAQMSHQEKIIEQKKKEILAKLEAKKASVDKPTPEEDTTKVIDQEEKKTLNIFNNDGSFLSNFKNMKDKRMDSKLKSFKSKDHGDNAFTKWSQKPAASSPKDRPSNKQLHNRLSRISDKNYASFEQQKITINTSFQQNFDYGSVAVQQSFIPEQQQQSPVQNITTIKENLINTGEMPIQVQAVPAPPVPQSEFQVIVSQPVLFGVPQTQIPTHNLIVSTTSSDPINLQIDVNVPTVELASIPAPNPIQVQNIPQPAPLNAVNIPQPAPLQLQNIPQPAPLQLNEIPNPKPLDLMTIPTPNGGGGGTNDDNVDAEFLKNIPPPNKSIPPPGGSCVGMTIPPPPSAPAQNVLVNAYTPVISIPALMAQPILPPPGILGAVNVTCPPPALLATPPPVPPTFVTQLPPMSVPPPVGVPMVNVPAPHPPPGPDLNTGTPDYESMASLARMVAQCGPGIQDVVQQRKKQDPSLWFLFHKESAAYAQYQRLIEKFKAEMVTELSELTTSSANEYKPEDAYEPEAALNDVDDQDVVSRTNDSGGNSNNRRKRKSRWGDKASDVSTSLPVVTIDVPVLTANVPVIRSGPVMLTKITRTDPALLQYARQTYGSLNLTDEEWKKAEDHYKINLLYQDMVKKREEVERLKLAGKNKYDYDSDEETDGGTWEHKLREKEMTATQLWADELTRQAEGKHHIGDFLPPEEFKRFLEKSNATKEVKQLNFSDYKEFKIKEDNIGYKMLQKLGWTEGSGLGSEGTGIVDPVNKAANRDTNQGLGMANPDEYNEDDDEYESYRKRMMLAYRFRPNPLNNPRRPYY